MFCGCCRTKNYLMPESTYVLCYITENVTMKVKLFGSTLSILPSWMTTNAILLSKFAIFELTINWESRHGTQILILSTFRRNWCRYVILKPMTFGWFIHFSINDILNFVLMMTSRDFWRFLLTQNNSVDCFIRKIKWKAQATKTTTNRWLRIQILEVCFSVYNSKRSKNLKTSCYIVMKFKKSKGQSLVPCFTSFSVFVYFSFLLGTRILCTKVKPINTCLAYVNEMRNNKKKLSISF